MLLPVFFSYGTIKDIPGDILGREGKDQGSVFLFRDLRSMEIFVPMGRGWAEASAAEG